MQRRRGELQASIYAALCDLTLTRLGLRRINTRIASRRAIEIDSPIEPVMELPMLFRVAGGRGGCGP